MVVLRLRFKAYNTSATAVFHIIHTLLNVATTQVWKAPNSASSTSLFLAIRFHNHVLLHSLEEAPPSCGAIKGIALRRSR
jgi:hypothetical protein